MNDLEILKKLVKIFANQQIILKKLAQERTPAESMFLIELEKAKQTPEWQNASEEQRRDFESDLRESIMSLMSEDMMMGSLDDLG